MMGNGHDGQGWSMNDAMGWGGWLMMSLVVLACLALVGAVVYLLVRGSRNETVSHDPGPSVRPSAQATLDERFARGEVDEDDYHRRSAALRVQ